MVLKLWWCVEKARIQLGLDGSPLIRSRSLGRTFFESRHGLGLIGRRCPMGLKLWWCVEKARIQLRLDGSPLIRAERGPGLLGVAMVF